jgi:cytochrome c biogenesis protein CcmG, thiol:disulfide interchange protein DsbE
MTASAPAPAGAEATTPAGRRRNALATVAILAITGAVILAAAYLSNPRLGESADGNFTPVSIDGVPVGAAPAVDSPAPDFIALLTDGSELRLSDLRGKPVWLTFGASWCQPCRAENPDIAATYAANLGKIAVVQVYMQEDAAAVKDYTERVGISYLTVPDPSQALSAQYRILGIPSHFFIDANGVLRQIKVGSLDPITMQAAIDELNR